MQTKEILQALNDLLEPEKFKDYAPNGLQVQGLEETQKIICGVSASEALIDVAIQMGAQSIIVHHGYFWKNESPRIVGIKRNRIKKLLTHDINLIAFHLPLDAHPEIGNNVLFGRAMGVKTPSAMTSEPFVWYGELQEPVTIDGLRNNLNQILAREVFVESIESAPAEIKKVAWCTGAGQEFLETAAELGVQAFISGEISERTILESRELGIPYFCVGHHASETFGIAAVAKWLHEKYPSLEVDFVDIVNPV